MRRNHIRLAILVLAVVVSTQMFGQSYTYQSIDFPGAQETYVYGINNAGDIVGGYRSYVPGPEVAWKRIGGTFSAVSMPSDVAWSQAQGINDYGHIVGQYETVSGRFGFIIDGSGFHQIEKSGAYDTYALDITNAGMVVGNYDDGAGTRGFIYSNGVLTPIDLPNTPIDAMHMARIGGTNSTGSAIVGGYMIPGETHAFILKGGTVQFVDYPGSIFTSFDAVNDLNQMVGYTSSNMSSNGFFYSGKFTTISFPGAMWGTMPTGINNKGEIVGVYYDTADTPHGFLATPAVTIDSLISMLDGFFAAGAIKNANAYAGLRDKLLAAKSSIERGANRTAVNQLRAFEQQLNADTLVQDSARQGLIAAAQALITVLGSR